MEETTKKKTITFHEFLCQRQFFSDRTSRVLAFADYFLFYFDSFEQMANETGIPRVDIDEILITRLKEIDNSKYQGVMEKVKRSKLIQVADYIISTGASTRKAALEFGLSNATISDWMTKLLPTEDADRYKKYLSVREQNRPKTIDDEEVVTRINEAVELIIVSGFTINEVAEALHTTPMTIARDLERRLPRMKNVDKEKIKRVSEVLKFHSASHPRKQSKK